MFVTCIELFSYLNDYQSLYVICMIVIFNVSEIISKVAATTKAPFRPKFPYMSDNNQAMEQTKAIQALIQRCWAEDPQVRPSVKRVLKTLNTISPFK